MRVVVGTGNRRQQWEINPQDYRDKRKDVNALLEYVGLKK